MKVVEWCFPVGTVNSEHDTAEMKDLTCPRSQSFSRPNTSMASSIPRMGKSRSSSLARPNAMWPSFFKFKNPQFGLSESSASVALKSPHFARIFFARVSTCGATQKNRRENNEENKLKMTSHTQVFSVQYVLLEEYHDGIFMGWPERTRIKSG